MNNNNAMMNNKINLYNTYNPKMNQIFEKNANKVDNPMINQMNSLNMNSYRLIMYPMEINNQNNMNMNDFLNKSKELYNHYNYKFNQNHKNNHQKPSLNQINQPNLRKMTIPNLLNNNNKICGKSNVRNMNIVFINAKCHKITISIPCNVKVYDLLCKYMKKIGLNPNLIGKEKIFLYNTIKLTQNDYNKLVQNTLYDMAYILVLDTKNLIGA